MSATAIISAASHQRICWARSWLESRAAAEEVLIVGATLDATNEFVRTAAKTTNVAFGWHRLTLPQLAATVAAPLLAVRGLAPLSRIGTEAIAARLVYRLKKEGGLSRYEAVASTPGFPRAVAQVLTELRMARLTPTAIGAIAPDLVPLVTAYEAELAAASLTDWPSILALATEAASGSRTERHQLIGLPTLLLDVSVGTQAEFAFIRALTAAAPEWVATIASADEPTLKHIRDALGARFETVAETTFDCERVERDSLGRLASLQQNLFNEQAQPSAAGPDDAVEVFSAPGEGRECMEIVRRVLSLARCGVSLDRIAILLRSPGGIPHESGGGLRSSWHPGSLRARRAETRSGGSSLLRFAQMRSGGPLRAALRGIFVAWASA